MKYLVSVLITLFFFVNCNYIFSQKVLSARTAPLPITLYSGAGFSGITKTIADGSNISLTDFNDKCVSIRVQPGYYVTLYEHADEAGGYGLSIDLMEDCLDLNKYRLANKVSYITVGNTNRQGYVWVRGRFNAATYMPGHWERAKATGTIDNSIAVLSPPQPSKIVRPTAPVISQPPTGDVSDHRTDKNTLIAIEENATEFLFKLTSLGNILPADQQLWDKAVNDQLGIIGSDYRGYEDIGSAAFERAAEAIYIPNNLNFWYPQKQTSPQPTNLKYYKRTLIGRIDSRQRPEVQAINEEYKDYDVNIHIKPDAKYMYLVNEAHKPEKSNKQWIKEVASNASIKHPWATYIDGCPTRFTTVEAEVELGNDAEEKFMPLVNQRPEKQIAVYGPWIWDEGHCHQPEIHPSEQIWWNDNVNNQKTYTCNLFCDASKRFWWRNQMDDDALFSQGAKGRPWGAPPIKGVFAIAFEVSLGNGLSVTSSSQKIFEVTNISDFNVRDYLKTDNIHGDKVYNLNYQGKNIVSFIPHNNAFKVSFEKIGLVPATTPKGTNRVRGFLVIETEVGTCTLKNNGKVLLNGVSIQLPANATADNVAEEIETKAFQKVDGHYMFKITETTRGSNPLIEAFGKIN